MRDKLEEKQRKLTKEEIQEAIEKKICPYCKDEYKSFWVNCQAFQELCFDEKGNVEWGDTESADIPDSINCKECGEEIPKEIWEKWF